VDFALAVPQELWFGAGEGKALLREAMRGRLPELVRSRRSKAEFSEIYLQVLRGFRAAIDLRDGRLAQRGWIDGQRFTSALELELGRAARGQTDGAALHTLWCAFALELWLQGLNA
jgi:asparagine synthase (glutamine-hydrolysing)